MSVDYYYTTGINTVSYLLSGTWRYLEPTTKYVIHKFHKVEPMMTSLWELNAAGRPFIRIAGLSGAIAVTLNAYISHSNVIMDAKQKEVFDIASRYHFMHTLALLPLPLCKWPYVSGTLMISGLVLFCGSCYHYAFTGNKRYTKLTPYGGSCFILGWLSMCV